ncbi:MAG: ATP-binding protein [Ilumatobacter sp.]|nr:ATP-binding protein [Ilumatobacter sp.]
MEVEAGGGWFEYGRGMLDVLASTREGDPADAAHLDALRDRLVEGLAGGSAFAIVTANADLTVDEAGVLATLAVAELDPAQHHRLAELQGDLAKRRMTLGTLAETFRHVEGHPGVLAVAARSALQNAAFVEVIADGPWSDHTIALRPGRLCALVGGAAPDPNAPQILRTVHTDVADGAPLTVVSGDDRVRRIDAAVAATSGTAFIVVPAPTEPERWAGLVREATITGTGVIVEVDAELPAAGAEWIERATHTSWSLVARRDLSLDELPRRAWRSVVADDHPPTDDEWAATFGDDVPRSHPLRADQLEQVGRAFAATGGDLDAAVRRLVSGRLEQLARRIRPHRTWDDLVLSEDRMAVLRTIVDRYQHADRVYDDWGFAASVSSRGVVSLFSGPSGTGKTLAAEVIAGQLGLDLFKIDLSSVVSKYIGETEKNLEEIFDAASAGNLVLFFDEADALFGKRSEVKDSRDRYANIEVSYLLQRLEAYEGLVVMATNFEKNVDDAFLRRIHTRIEFALPGPAERIDIWRKNLPEQAPIDDVDTEWLGGHFEISGGIIRNAAVHAAFRAAARDADITTGDAVLGVAFEFRKLGRLIKPTDFGEYFDLVTELPGAAPDT